MLKTTYLNVPKNYSAGNIYMATMLFLSTRRFFTVDESEHYLDQIFVRDLRKIPNDRDQGRLLLLMEMLEENKEVEKILHRRVRKLFRKSPDVLKSLVPGKRKGFR